MTSALHWFAARETNTNAGTWPACWSVIPARSSSLNAPKQASTPTVKRSAGRSKRCAKVSASSTKRRFLMACSSVTPDFLRRVSTPSDLGAYGYEVVNTKLALAPKAYYLVQLCNYSEHLARLQGHIPEFGHVVFGDGTEDRFRISDYMAYYRHLKHAFLEFAGDPSLEHIERPRQYPHRCRHCSDCVWRRACAAQRESDDHLSLVAAMRRDQIGKFENNGIARVSELATATDEQRPTGMNPETFAKLRRQAELQVRGRESRQPIYELLEHEPPLGFALLPAPSAGDVFFDMEGDPLYEPGRALEYLFGCWLPDDERPFRAFWGTTRADEKFAFESFVEFLIERRARYPSLHVYHYANYEKSALRRLAQEHRTKENEVERFAARGRARRSLRGRPPISGHFGRRLRLEETRALLRLTRGTEVRKGDDSIVMFERWMLEKDRRILDDIEAYNRDDCRSTFLLREWLLARRLEAAAAFGISFPFYEHRSSARASRRKRKRAGAAISSGGSSRTCCCPSPKKSTSA